MSEYESRTGKLTCTPEELYGFMTDIRNFGRFVPQGKVDDLRIEKDSCSFSVSMLGKVEMHLSEKEPNKRIEYKGTALESNYFTLLFSLDRGNTGNATVQVKLNAELNPVLKIVASEPIKRFLETLILEMENFRGWKDTIA